eukprot:Platyproteum_vivax@DN6690_c0_g1_i5.p1
MLDGKWLGPYIEFMPQPMRNAIRGSNQNIEVEYEVPYLEGAALNLADAIRDSISLGNEGNKSLIMKQREREVFGASSVMLRQTYKQKKHLPKMLIVTGLAERQVREMMETLRTLGDQTPEGSTTAATLCQEGDYPQEKKIKVTGDEKELFYSYEMMPPPTDTEYEGSYPVVGFFVNFMASRHGHLATKRGAYHALIHTSLSTARSMRTTILPEVIVVTDISFEGLVHLKALEAVVKAPKFKRALEEQLQIEIFDIFVAVDVHHGKKPQLNSPVDMNQIPQRLHMEYKTSADSLDLTNNQKNILKKLLGLFEASARQYSRPDELRSYIKQCLATKKDIAQTPLVPATDVKEEAWPERAKVMKYFMSFKHKEIYVQPRPQENMFFLAISEEVSFHMQEPGLSYTFDNESEDPIREIKAIKHEKEYLIKARLAVSKVQMQLDEHAKKLFRFLRQEVDVDNTSSLGREVDWDRTSSLGDEAQWRPPTT